MLRQQSPQGWARGLGGAHRSRGACKKSAGKTERKRTGFSCTLSSLVL